MRKKILKHRSKLVALIVAATLLMGALVVNYSNLEGRFGGKSISPLSPLGSLLPDLVVQDIYLDGDVLTAKIGNDGNKSVFTTGPAPNGHTYIYIDGTLEWTYSWTTLSDTSFLSKGRSSLLQPQTLETGHWVEVCVDAKDIISESNETNNCLNVFLDEEVTRGSFIADVMDDASYPLDSCTGGIFSDVDISDDYCAAVETAYNDGLISGHADGLYRGGNDMTRAEGSKLVTAIYGLTLSSASSPTFPDVSTADWYFTYVETLNDYGAADPDSAGNFRPSDSLMQSQLDHWMVFLP